MTIDLTRLSANTQTWAQTASTASVIVPQSDGGPRTLTGTAAAAYLFGQALTKVKYENTLDGVQLSDCRFQFPPGVTPPQWVSLAEVADALRYKYGVDPLIEFAPGLGARGYSIPDINRILESLNREFAGQFILEPISSEEAGDLTDETEVTFNAEKTAALLSSTGKVATNEYVAFSTNPNWVTGNKVRATATVGGLAGNTDYYVRNLGGGKYSFFASSGGAAGTLPENPIDLTSAAIGSNVTVSSVVQVSYTYNAPDTSTLLNTASTAVLAPATETELRQNLTEGGDLYTDRFGAFYLNGVRTQAMDVAVTSRLLVQDNVSAEYKTLMDELAERNNLIAAARAVLSAGLGGLDGAIETLAEQYGMGDVLSELTAGQYSDAQKPFATVSTDTVNESVRFNIDPGWPAGTPVKVSTSGGGLTQAVVYYVRPDGAGAYSFYDSQANARLTTTAGRIPLDSTIVTAVSQPDYISSGRSPISVAGSYLTVPGTSQSADSYSYRNMGYDEFSAPGSSWVTGSSIVPTRNISYDFVQTTRDPLTSISTTSTTNQTVMTQGASYYLRKISNGNYEIYNTPVNAAAGGTTGKIYFNSSIEGAIDLTNNNAATFNPDPLWANGTAVRVLTTGGGLTAGDDYYVRSHGLGNYSFFTTAAYATATGSPPPTTGRMNLTDPVTLNVKTVAELNRNVIDAADFTAITALLNTLISNKVRDGDLDQAKLQTLTAQLQNNTEAMTALIKAFTDMNAQLARAL